MMKKMMNIMSAGLLLGLVLTGCGDQSSIKGSATEEPKDTKLSEAWIKCLAQTNVVNGGGGPAIVKLADKDHSLLVDGVTNARGFKALTCLLNAAGISQATFAKIESTTAMMGRQSATEGKLTYEWSYHPSSGIDMTVTEKD